MRVQIAFFLGLSPLFMLCVCDWEGSALGGAGW